MNPENAILGLAVPFGVPTRDDRGPLHEHQFTEFTAASRKVDLRVPIAWGHRPPLPSAGEPERRGWWRAWGVSGGDPSWPAGLYALGEFTHAGTRDEVARVWADRRHFGLSVKLEDLSDAMDWSGGVWVEHLALEFDPAFELARVAGLGQDALERWETLTGKPYDGARP